jgi:hypothetical protein
MVLDRDVILHILEGPFQVRTKQEVGPGLEKSQFLRPQNLPAQRSGT